MGSFFLEISQGTLTGVLKIVATCAITVLTWFARAYLKNQKRMTEDIHEIKTMVAVMKTQHEGVITALTDVKERVTKLEDVVYER
jgi:hypothetical protein